MLLTISHSSWLSQRLSSWCYGILVGLVISGVSVSTVHAIDSAAGNLAGTIMFHNGRLTTKVTATPLQHVMKEIGKVSGVQIRWLNSEGEELVSAHFVALPFSEAIQRLLGERNFLLFYSSIKEGAGVTQVWISARKTNRKQREDAQQSLAQEPPLLNEEHASESEDFISPDMLLQTAIYDHGSVARLEAIARLEEYSRQDPRIPAALSHLVENDADLQIREAAAAVLEATE